MGKPRNTRATRKRLPACFTAKTQRKRGLLRPRQINRASYTANVLNHELHKGSHIFVGEALVLRKAQCIV